MGDDIVALTLVLGDVGDERRVIGDAGAELDVLTDRRAQGRQGEIT
jgi:hypothetical protein